MVMYRTDLMEKAGLEMPDAPTWEFVKQAAAAMTDKDHELYGVCLRGKAGWGENAAFITATSNSFGARWFDEDWKPQFDSEAWANTLNFYMDLMTSYVPPGASTNGFNENLSLFQQGKCGMWIDATVAASFVTNPKDSTGGRQRRIRTGAGQRSGQAQQLALGLVTGDSGRLGRHRRGQEVHHVGDQQGIHGARGVEGRLGQCPAGHPDLALREPGLPRGGAVRRDDAELDQRRRPDTADRRPGALYRYPVRRDSGIRGASPRRSVRSSRLRSPASIPPPRRSRKAQALTMDEMEAAGY